MAIMDKEHSKPEETEQPKALPEAAEVEELDLEEFSKMHGGKPPKAKRYIIRIDREKYTVNVPNMTGRQILGLAKKLPPENWLLNQKLKGGRVVAIGLNDVVDFTAPGVERFITLPKDQTEGFDGSRRQFQLPEAVRFDDEVAVVLRARPSTGPLFPYLREVRASDRATEFKQRCRGLKISGVTLHSYRYAWAERAKTAGYPERFAQQALGHNSKAVHRAYARHAHVVIPSLGEYEKHAQGQSVIPFPTPTIPPPTSMSQPTPGVLAPAEPELMAGETRHGLA